MTSTQAIDFYHSLLRFGVQPGLDRIKVLCAALGDPQNALSFVHVAGTNGKGTTCTETASILTAAGYKTGLFTSPYVLRFHERMQIDGRQIGDDALANVTARVKAAVEALNKEEIYPTEFESITAAAFLWFKEERCDLVVLEVGLGGRYDATNIIASPLVTCITSVSMDHTAVLGDTLAAIAGEKCGVIKPRCPVVTPANQKPEALRVIRETAAENEAPLCEVSPDALFSDPVGSIFGWRVCWQGATLTVPFSGAHQLENAALSITLCILLREKGYSISNDAILRGMEAAFLPARTEVLQKEPPIILDGSHNEGSTRALAALLRTCLPGKKILAVMGMMADKDTDAILDNLLPLLDGVIAVTPSNPRAMAAETLCARIKKRKKACVFAEDLFLGIDKALSDLYDNYEVLLICGSLYLAADCRDYLLRQITEKNPSEIETKNRCLNAFTNVLKGEESNANEH